MDTLTHFAAGALTPMAFRKAPRCAALVAFGVLCGEFPDVDIIAGTAPKALLLAHRGITHALFSLPLLALCAVLLFYPFLSAGMDAQKRLHAPPPEPWSIIQAFGAACLTILTHLYLDCVTTFGTRIFLPFSHYRVALPGLFIIDLLFTGVLMVLLFKVLRGLTDPARLERQVRLARIALLWILCYPLACLGIGQVSDAYLNARYAGGVAHIRLMPDPFAPFIWKAVAEKGAATYAIDAFYPLAPLRDMDFARTFERADPTLWAKLQKEIPIFADYATFVTFPAQRRVPLPDGGQEYRFFDLRYTWAMEDLAKKFGRGDGNFIMEARVDKDGRIAAWRYLSRGRDEGVPWIKIEG